MAIYSKITITPNPFSFHAIVVIQTKQANYTAIKPYKLERENKQIAHNIFFFLFWKKVLGVKNGLWQKQCYFSVRHE